VLLPGYYILSIADLYRRFLTCQGKPNIPAACFAIGVIPHLVVSYLLIYRYRMDILGAGIAVVVSNAIIYLMIYCSIRFYCTDISPNATTFRLDKTICDLEKLKSFMKLGVPSIVMLCLSWWAWEIMIIISGLYSQTD
jgi:multidrug resistance protein, MATE family